MTIEARASTDARVYLDVDERALVFLDAFEDAVYERTLINIRLSSTEPYRKAFA